MVAEGTLTTMDDVRGDPAEALRAQLRSTLADAEAQVTQQLDASRDKTNRRVNTVVELAQGAWDDGLVYFSVRFPSSKGIEGSTQVLLKALEQARSYSSIFEGRDIGLEQREFGEASWNEALARVVAVGWSLHTWQVLQIDGVLIPIALFQRPSE